MDIFLNLPGRTVISVIMEKTASAQKSRQPPPPLPPTLLGARLAKYQRDKRCYLGQANASANNAESEHEVMRILKKCALQSKGTVVMLSVCALRVVKSTIGVVT